MNDCKFTWIDSKNIELRVFSLGVEKYSIFARLCFGFLQPPSQSVACCFGIWFLYGPCLAFLLMWISCNGMGLDPRVTTHRGLRTGIRNLCFKDERQNSEQTEAERSPSLSQCRLLIEEDTHTSEFLFQKDCAPNNRETLRIGCHNASE